MTARFEDSGWALGWRARSARLSSCPSIAGGLYVICIRCNSSLLGTRAHTQLGACIVSAGIDSDGRISRRAQKNIRRRRSLRLVPRRTSGRVRVHHSCGTANGLLRLCFPNTALGGVCDQPPRLMGRACSLPHDIHADSTSHACHSRSVGFHQTEPLMSPIVCDFLKMFEGFHRVSS